MLDRKGKELTDNKTHQIRIDHLMGIPLSYEASFVSLFGNAS